MTVLLFAVLTAVLAGCPVEPDPYDIAITASEGGTVDPGGPLTVAPGGTVTLNITPQKDYDIADVVIDGVSVGVVDTYTFYDVSGPHKVEIWFALDEYDQGFSDGFLEDDWYWTGFYDSYDTIDLGPIYYQGSEITYVEEPLYDADYWEGVWYAYNDGYFVDYDYAFTIGFSEGYDAAYAIDYLAFLAADEHLECDDGGWTDGYNDGFSEGRVFGANDYEMGLPLDWLDAQLDYRSGTDLYFEEVGFGTGLYGPVYLYEYGTDPNVAVKAAGPSRPLGEGRTIRADAGAAKNAEDVEIPPISYRTLPDVKPERIAQSPDVTPRGNRPITLTATRGERITAYLNATQTGAKSLRTRRVEK
jgi:hypothetical protein